MRRDEFSSWRNYFLYILMQVVKVFLRIITSTVVLVPCLVWIVAKYTEMWLQMLIDKCHDLRRKVTDAILSFLLRFKTKENNADA